MLEKMLLKARQKTLADAQPHDGSGTWLKQPALSPELQAVIAQCPGDWAITPAAAGVLGQAVSHLGAQNILEFGAGSSSVVLATALALAGGGKLTAIEQNPRWCADQWAFVQQQPQVESHMVEGQPQLGWGRLGLYFSFKQAAKTLATRGPFDLVVVDAPQYFFGRDGALPLVYRYLTPTAWIILDDAGREAERWAMARWLSTYPGLKLVYDHPDFGEKGLAVLRCQGRLQPRWSPWAFVSGAKHTVATLRDPALSRLRAEQRP
ncbi:MAG: class I SAM-dependent methyltransferase [Nodosilinea sp.]